MTKTNWDYTQLADAYLKRPQYAPSAIEEVLNVANVKEGDLVCDIGAGVAHLTLLLARKGLTVRAVEPNDAMRKNGIERTKELANVSWFDGTGEATGQEDSTFDLVTFGSSFNVTDRLAALRETWRILKPGKWFACMWNHRDLSDPLQKEIERIIASSVPDFEYGTRREDQTEIIQRSGLFGAVIKVEGTIVHSQSTADCLEAWRSHATLQRQAKEKLDTVISDIERLLSRIEGGIIHIPYTTRLWTAQALPGSSL